MKNGFEISRNPTTTNEQDSISRKESVMHEKTYSREYIRVCNEVMWAERQIHA